MVKDYLVRAMAKPIGLRILLATTGKIVSEAQQNHQTNPVTTNALGRALTSAALIGALLKVNQRVAMKFEGSGPLQKIIVESNSYGRVRGYISPTELDLPANDLVAALGQAGILTVVKDVNLPELIESITPLQTSNIDTDVQAYLTQSEQIPSTVHVDLQLHENGHTAAAGGILIQAVPPNGDPDTVELLTNRLLELPPLASLINDNQTPETILQMLLHDIDFTILEQRELEYKCNCSRERSLKALITLGKAELEYLRDIEKEAVVDCHFCHKQYLFDDLDLEILIEDMEMED